MHIPPPGPQRMRCNSLIFGWTLILVGLLLFPIGGFLLMAGGSPCSHTRTSSNDSSATQRQRRRLPLRTASSTPLSSKRAR